VERALGRVDELLEEPVAVGEIGWRFQQARGLAALDGGDPAAAVAALETALGDHRRTLRIWQAGGLWNDLGLARAHGGDLAGSERAFLHAQRLLGRCDGPRQATLALANLAEVRLRRGRLGGVAAILRRGLVANRAAGNLRGMVHDLVLSARLEMALGRSEAALDRLAEAADRAGTDGWQAAERRVLEARALGWLGRGDEARTALEAVGCLGGELEPEERPAVRALAGDWEGALREATELATAEVSGTSWLELWRALAEGREVPVELWGPVERLESFRCARAVLDAEMAAARVREGPAAPAPLRRRSATVLRRMGAVAFAERLERLDRLGGGSGAWGAVETYLDSGEPGHPRSLRALFEGAGFPEVRLEWLPDALLARREDGWGAPVREAEILVGGAGGGEELSAPLADGGTLRLTAVAVDPTLRALFALARAHAGPSELPERSTTFESGEIIGESPCLLDALERLDRLARGEVPVLLAGESGTGKELAARRLHRRSARRQGPFVALNCAAVDENLLTSDLFGHVRGAFTGADRDRVGVFETAGGGTVFLDEIGDLPARAQGMLLRVLQEGEVRRVGESTPRPVDARVVAASHRDLATLVADGAFRQDLFYRLAVARVELPALRDRGTDALLLARAFLERWGGGQRLSREVRDWVLFHRFPGNVRELENVLRVAALLAGDGGVIGPEHLPEAVEVLPEDDGEGSYREKVDAYRCRLVAEALAATDGNQAAAARQLGLTRQALSYLTRQLGIV
jgi:DNA-binding NtrC family response regulator/tetratricopeptide (TPR) repeat protein